MCRNIHELYNVEPAATDEDVRAAALQYVRKVSGTTRPSRANQEAFDRAVQEVAHATEHLLAALVTQAPPRDREVLAARRRARAAQRYAGAVGGPAPAGAGRSVAGAGGPAPAGGPTATRQGSGR